MINPELYCTNIYYSNSIGIVIILIGLCTSMFFITRIDNDVYNTKRWDFLGQSVGLCSLFIFPLLPIIFYILPDCSYNIQIPIYNINK